MSLYIFCFISICTYRRNNQTAKKELNSEPKKAFQTYLLKKKMQPLMFSWVAKSLMSHNCCKNLEFLSIRHTKLHKMHLAYWNEIFLQNYVSKQYHYSLSADHFIAH